MMSQRLKINQPQKNWVFNWAIKKKGRTSRGWSSFPTSEERNRLSRSTLLLFPGSGTEGDRIGWRPMIPGLYMIKSVYSSLALSF